MTKRVLLLLTLILASATVAFGQSGRYDSVLIGPRGPISNALVAVCTQPAITSTTPCSTLATLATSASTTSGGANPLTTDAFGNFHFYAAAGVAYTIQAYGPQLSTPFIMNDVTVPGGAGAGIVVPGVLLVGAGTSWPGVDIGAQINNIYASSACPATGCSIAIVPQLNGYSYVTPINLNTAQKPVKLYCLTTGGSDVGGIGRSCKLNYTPTSGDAITLDFMVSSGFGLTTGIALQDIYLVNNNCTTTAGCGGTARGVVCGPTNGGCGGETLQSVLVAGFSTGIVTQSNNGWGTVFSDVSLLNNATGWNQLVTAENMQWRGGKFIGNGTAFLGTNSLSEVFGESLSFDGNTVMAVNMGTTVSNGLGFQCTGCHFENPGGTTANFITGNGGLILKGGSMADDTASASVNWFISVGGFWVDIDGTLITSSGQTATQVLQATGSVRGQVRFINGSPTTLTVLTGGAAVANVTDLSMPSNNSNVQPIFKLEKGVRLNHLEFAVGGGAAPGCASTGLGTGGTCTIAGGSSDSGGVIFLNTGSGATAATGTITLTLNTATGVNGVGCLYTLNAALGAWNARASIFATSTNSTTVQTSNWDNNAVVLTISTVNEVNYFCPGH